MDSNTPLDIIPRAWTFDDKQTITINYRKYTDPATIYTNVSED